MGVQGEQGGGEQAGVSEPVPRPQTPAAGGRHLVEAGPLPAQWSNKQATGNLRRHCIVLGEAASCCKPRLLVLSWPVPASQQLPTGPPLWLCLWRQQRLGMLNSDEEEVLGNTGQEEGMGSRPQVMDQ